MWPPHHHSALIVGAGGIAEAEPVDRGFPGAVSHLASGVNMRIKWNSNDTTAKLLNWIIKSLKGKFRAFHNDALQAKNHQ